MPIEDGRTGAEELASEPIGAPWSFPSVPDGLAPFGSAAEAPLRDWPARMGMDGSTMPISVCTDADGCL